jgi:hypothetical protein
VSELSEGLSPEVSPGFERHVQSRTIVLPEHRVLFLPIPKAGCTSVLWLLAGLAGLEQEDFARSVTPEVSPALTVHDITIWHPHNRFSEYDPDEQRSMLEDDDWLRFTIVRHPATRLWSAWQSKLLLREPRFVQTFGEEAWFPRMPESPGQVLEDFRKFVAVAGEEHARDVHWAVQQELVSQLSFTHVGRVERMQETMDLLREHVGEGEWGERPPTENRTPMALAPAAYDEDAEALLRARYAADFEAFGYDPDEHLGGDGDAQEEWEREVAAIIPALRHTAGEHARVEQLLKNARMLLKRVETAEEDLVERDAKRIGVTRARGMRNREGNAEYNVRWSWAEGDLEPGFTAVLRVKNEARTLPYSLPPLARAVRRLVLVDNGSTDGTPAVARRIAREHGFADRLDVHHYPFSISRCGPEHLGTPEDSLHNLAYYYNWCFSHVRTTYALKWDGDMVLSDDAVEVFRDLEWQLEAGPGVVIRVPRYPTYLSGDATVAYLDTGLRNNEPWGWPNKPGFSFVKAMEWEMPVWGKEHIESLQFPDWGCAELKFLDEDEFGHWTDTNFERSARQQRKLREYRVFRALSAGDEPPEDVVRIENPAGGDVVEHIRTVWLPARAREEISLVTV